MASSILCRVLFVMWAGAVPIEVYGNSYTVADLGYLVTPVEINSKGMIAGNIERRPARGEVYRGGSWHNLPPQSQASSINDKGDVVGVQYGEASLNIWPQKGTAILIDVPPGGADGTAVSINDDRTVVGYYHAGNNVDCYIWTPTQGAID